MFFKINPELLKAIAGRKPSKSRRINYLKIGPVELGMSIITYRYILFVDVYILRDDCLPVASLW